VRSRIGLTSSSTIKSGFVSAEIWPRSIAPVTTLRIDPMMGSQCAVNAAATDEA